MGSHSLGDRRSEERVPGETEGTTDRDLYQGTDETGQPPEDSEGGEKAEPMSKLTKEEMSLAKLGIIALIDEATGYQSERAKDGLKKELEKIKAEDDSWENN